MPFLMSFMCSRDVKQTTQVTTPQGTIKSTTEVSKPTKPKISYPYDRDNRNGSSWMQPATVVIETPSGVYKIHFPGVAPHARETGKVEIWDPLVMQVPSDWVLSNVVYTTAAGSGAATVSSGPVPCALTEGASGPYVSDYFVAESGYTLYLIDIPDADKVAGVAKLKFDIEAPSGAQRVDQVKLLPTFTMVEDTLGLTVYVAADGDWPTDFGALVDPEFILDFDMSALKCTGPGGYSPHFDQDLTTTWEIGTSANVNAVGLDPSLPVSVLFGSTTFYFPGISIGGLGCVAQISPDASFALSVSGSGEASVGLSIPNDPGLKGLRLNFQALQVTQASDLLTGSTLQVTIE